MSSSYGAKPRLDWLPVAELFVDTAYQRSIETRRSAAVIDRIAERFRWSLFGSVIVTRGLTGWLIIDGQHRVEAARRVGLESVPCIVVDAPSKADQAAAFVGANRDRVAVSSFAVHHAMVAAGDETAGAIDRVCAKSGVEIPRYPIPLAHLKPNQTLTIATIGASIARHGEHVTAETLAALREAFPVAGALRAHLIAALAALKAARPTLARTTIVRLLSEHGLAALEGGIVAGALQTGAKRATVAAAAIAALLPEPEEVAPAVRAKPAPAKISAPVAPARIVLPTSRVGTAPAQARKARNDEAAQIAAHIAANGVTKVAPAAVAPTTAPLQSAFDHEVVQRHRGRPSQAELAARAISNFQRDRQARR